MKKETTYNPQDMEDLLLNKSFDELYSDEKEFVLTEVENEQEYNEMRDTLLAVKQIAADQESVYVPNKIKEDLMKLMEKKKKPLGWFSLNSIGAFLFPSNTSLYQKPGLQIATLGLLLLLVINIGFDFVNVPKNEMAINTTPKLEKQNSSNNDIKNSIEPKNSLKTEEVKEEEPKNTIEKIESENKDILEVRKKEIEPNFPKIPTTEQELTLSDASVEVEDNIEELVEIAEDDLIVEQPKVKSESMDKLTRNDNFFRKEVTQLDEEVTVVKDSEQVTLSYTNATTQVADFNGLTLGNSVEVTVDKSKITTKKLSSQSLDENAEIIDLLFVAL